MAIAWVAGAAGDGSGTATLTVPAGVTTGDACLLFGVSDSHSTVPAVTSTAAGQPALATPSSGANPVSTGAFNIVFGIWAMDGGGQAGATISAANGGSGNVGLWLGAWRGASASLDGLVITAPGSTGTTYTAPSYATGNAGCWAIEWCASTNSFVSVTVPAGTTTREALQGTLANGAIVDGNGSVGPAGTTAGGGVWAWNGSVALGGALVTLAPAGSPPPASPSGLLMAGII